MAGRGAVLDPLRPAWLTRDDPGEAQRVGALGIAHGTPTRYDVTIYQVMITQLGQAAGYTMQSLCDEA